MSSVSLPPESKTIFQETTPPLHSGKKEKAGIMPSVLPPTDFSPNYSRQSEYKGHSMLRLILFAHLRGILGSG